MKKYQHKFETYITKLLFYFLKKFSIERSSFICGWVAKKIGPYLNVSNIARKNLQIANITKADHEEIISSMWENFGRVAGEFPHVYNLSDNDFLNQVKIIGKEHIKFVQESNQAIFFSGHLANWEVAARTLVSQDIKLALIYRKLNNKEIDKLVLNERSKNRIKPISKGREGGREIIESLNQGYNLAMLVDQKLNEGIEVPFFNKPAMTAPAIAKLAAKYNIPLIPIQVIRNNNSSFTVKFFPAIYVDKSEEDYVYKTMLNINQILEKWILDNPSQWFWLHRRWPK